MITFTPEDLKQIEAEGLTLEQIQSQIELFERGDAFLKLNRACGYNDGILKIDDDEQALMLRYYESAQSKGRASKFVPASGAASRMFKALFSAADEIKSGCDPHDKDFIKFIEQVEEFAFYPEWSARLAARGMDAREMVKTDLLNFMRELINKSGMCYGTLPKALLSFHLYPDGPRTPVEEHFVEAERYIADASGKARLHFTVSPEHMDAFHIKVAELTPKFQARGIELQISYSIQHNSTNTIAVTPENKPFIDEGKLLFRPGGHGALLRNLNEKPGGDIIFIKNIDNVVPDHLKDETVLYKKLIGGVLLRVQERIFNHLKWLDENELNDAKRAELMDFLPRRLGIKPPASIEKRSNQEAKGFFHALLNRPIRVCGMVLNVGEPGGGPFWVDRKDGSCGLQIVESSQVNLNDPQQKEILQGSTHFNPVDLVCAITDYKGNKFDLMQFSDPDACFISHKTKDGKPLKALELPGLWNGAMSNWTTLFVEVPLATFNPVKSVNDLLRPEHRA